MTADSLVSSDNAVNRAELLQGTGLNASMSVNDMQKSLSWYQDVLGFSVAQKYEREGKLVAASLQAGDAKVLIAQDDGAKGWDRVKGVAISLQITTAQNIDEVANRIKTAGGVLESEPANTPWGARMFRIKDPDGFVFVVSSQ